MSFIDSLLTAPLPNLLIVLGAFFFLLAVVSEITHTPLGSLTADGYGRAIALAIGPMFLILGVMVLLVTTPAAPGAPVPGSTQDQGVADGMVETLTPSVADTTPPDQLTPIDRTLTRTPRQGTPVRPTTGRVLIEREPNDDALNADTLGPGDSVSGAVRSTYSADPSLDSDYFAVWLEAGDPLTVEVNRDGGVGTLYVVVLDPNGFSKPSGNWLSDIEPVGSDGWVEVDTVATQTGYHYVLVSGWIYLADLDLYYNDGGNGEYLVEVWSEQSASLDDPVVEAVGEATPGVAGDAVRVVNRAVV